MRYNDTLSSSLNSQITFTNSFPTISPVWWLMVWLKVRRWFLRDHLYGSSAGKWMYCIRNNEYGWCHFDDHPSHTIKTRDGIFYKNLRWLQDIVYTSRKTHRNYLWVNLIKPCNLLRNCIAYTCSFWDVTGLELWAEIANELQEGWAFNKLKDCLKH